jgi:hypothetical protein
LLDAGPENIPFPECDNPIDFDEEACPSWRHSFGQIRRVGGLSERRRSTWPAGHPQEVEDMGDLHISIMMPEGQPQDAIACLGETCLHHCHPAGLSGLRRDVYPLYQQFSVDPSAYCTAALTGSYASFYQEECEAAYTEAFGECEQVGADAEAYERCATNAEADAMACLDLIPGHIDAILGEAIPAVQACSSRTFRGRGPRDDTERLDAQIALPRGRILVDQFTSNRCPPPGSPDERPDRLCVEGAAQIRFDKVLNFRNPRSGGHFQTAIDSQLCLEANAPYFEGGGACSACWIDDPEGNFYWANQQDGPIPTKWVPTVVDDTRGFPLPPCEFEAQAARWRSEVEACTQRPYVVLFDEMTLNEVGLLEHTPGRWIPLDENLEPQPNLGALVPGERRWVFEGSGRAFAQPPQPIEMVALADCLALAHQRYLSWVLDHDEDGRCDGVVCPEIVSPTGDPTAQEGSDRFDPLSEVVFSADDGVAEFTVVVEGIRDPASMRVHIEPLMDAGGPIEAILGERVVEDPSLGRVSVVAYYPRMPLANSAFGPRTVEVCVPAEEAPGCPGRRGEEVCDVQTIEVFWPLFQDVAAGLECLDTARQVDLVDLPREVGQQIVHSCMEAFASNHPGEDATVEDLCPLDGSDYSPRRAPNWHHYWKQSLRGYFPIGGVSLLSVGYIDELAPSAEYSTLGSFLSVECWPIVRQNDEIGVFPMGGVKGDWGNGHEFGIVAFLSTVAHEIFHHSHYLQNTLEGLGRSIETADLVSVGDWSKFLTAESPLYNHYFDRNGDGEYSFCLPMEGTRHCSGDGLCADLRSDGELPCCPERFISETDAQIDWNGDGVLSSQISVFGCDTESLDADLDDVPNWHDLSPLNRDVDEETLADSKESAFMSQLFPSEGTQIRSLDWGCPGTQCSACRLDFSCRLLEVD